MSHPIDDLFRNGLKNASLQGHDKDWQEARELLGFEQQKNRPYFWLWFIGGLLFLLLSATYFYSIHADKKEQSEIKYASEINTSNEAISERNIYKQDSETGMVDPVQNESKQLQEPDNQIVQGKSGQLDRKSSREIVENKSVSPSKSAIVTRQEVDPQIEYVFPAIKNNEVVLTDENRNKLSTENKDLVQTDLSSLKSESSIALDHENQSSDISESERRLGPETPATNTTDTHSGSLSETTRSNLVVDIGVSGMESSALSGPAPVDKIPLQFLSVPQGTIDRIPIIATTAVVPFQDHVRFGLYTSYSPDRNLLEGGLTVHWDFRSNWLFDFGLGMSRYSRQENASYDNLTLVDRVSQSANSSLFSTNEYRYYSLSLPIRLHRKFNRHSIFTGFVLERPLFLRGRQVVSLSPEMLDTASPGNPLGLSGSNDPITSVQEYNLRSAPQLEKFFLYGQLGYRYEFSRRLSISALGLIRWTDQEAVSPLIDVSQVNQSSSVTRLHAQLRLDYTFY